MEDWPVMIFENNGDVRAYPLTILIYHEIVNDVVGLRELLHRSRAAHDDRPSLPYRAPLPAHADRSTRNHPRYDLRRSTFLFFRVSIGGGLTGRVTQAVSRL